MNGPTKRTKVCMAEQASSDGSTADDNDAPSIQAMSRTLVHPRLLHYPCLKRHYRKHILGIRAASWPRSHRNPSSHLAHLTCTFLFEKFLKEFLRRNSTFHLFHKFLKEFLEKEDPCRIFLLRFAGRGIPCRNSLRNFPPFPYVSTRLVTSQVPVALESLAIPFTTQ